MTRGQRRSLVRHLHSGLGWLLAGLLVLVAGSGIMLQHPDWLGSRDNPPLSVAVNPTNADHLLRGTHWGVEVSVDGGHRWREVNMLTAPTDVVRVLFAVQEDSVAAVYALGRDGLVVSDDGGRIWSEVPLPAAVRTAGAQPVDLAVGPECGLVLLTTGGSFKRTQTGQWHIMSAPPEGRRDWHRWLHDLHTGQIGGTVGRRVGEGAAWGLVLLVLSGLVLQQRVRRRGRS